MQIPELSLADFTGLEEDFSQSFYSIGMVDDDPRKARMRVNGYEVIGTTADSITIGENYLVFPGGNNPINAQLIYGMLIWDEVNGTPVKAAGPTFMANDDDNSPGPDFSTQVSGFAQAGSRTFTSSRAKVTSASV